MNEGVVRAVKDLIVIVTFDEDFPDIREVIVVEDIGTPLLVDSMQTGGQAVCLNTNSDRRIQKGMRVNRTGKSIEIPVGDELIGRVMDVTGLPLDGLPPVTNTKAGVRDIFVPPPQAEGFGAVAPE